MTKGRVGRVLALLALGCGTPQSTVATDVRAYLERSKEWAPRESEAERTIQRILRTEFVDEADVRRQIADSRPRLQVHLEQVRAYQARSEAVARLHERYVAAWQTLLAGFDDIGTGFDSSDQVRLARGREEIMAWRRGIVRVASELREMLHRYHIQPTAAADVGDAVGE